MNQRTRRHVAVIGSAARGLPAYLSEALDVCLRLGIIPVMTEPTAGGDASAVEVSLGLLDEADVYIGIGGEVPAHADLDTAIGEMEYERARKLGIPRLMFTAGPNERAEPDASDSVAAPESSEQRVGGSQVVRRVNSPREFGALLLDAFSSLGIRGRTRAVQKTLTKKDTSDREKGGGDGSAKDAQADGGGPGKPKRTFRVFVASPRDVHAERSLMPKVVESLNRTLGKMLGVAVELWRWETDAQAAAGEPQPLIDAELGEADVVLVIFWNRFGTPTSAGPTGTESEVLRSLARWREARRPQVMIYFCQRPALLGREGLEQRLQLLEFRERIAPLALVVDYTEAEEFAWRARDDLFVTIGRLCVLPDATA
jgi:hypothetical protein